MNYDPNTKRWKKGDIVIHDADAKNAKMLMKVIKVDGIIMTTKYMFKPYSDLNDPFDNHMEMLHDPAKFDITIPEPEPKIEPDFTKENSITVTGFVWDPSLHPEDAETISSWKSGGVRVKISDLESIGFFQKTSDKLQSPVAEAIRKAQHEKTDKRMMIVGRKQTLIESVYSSLLAHEINTYFNNDVELLIIMAEDIVKDLIGISE